MGIIQYSALAQVFAEWFVAVSTPRTYPVLAYWYSGILNYFVPSGGSEWIITAPYLLEAARRLGVSYATITITYAWGHDDRYNPTVLGHTLNDDSGR